ncbi:hypothetical protein WER97_08985 [Staphylococcus felis]|uniref:hypothetical protein n=1 Tax=Staphylococcus felis TaxID=46127 RepID=UPI0018DB69E6|nr:hypothetical protein [Staphylococcus felis]
MIFEILKNLKGADLNYRIGKNIQTVNLLTGLYGLIHLINDAIQNVLRLEI